MSDDIEIEQIDGGARVTIPRARWNKYPSIRESFRPVAEKKAPSGVVKETTPVVVEPPTGDEKKEN